MSRNWNPILIGTFAIFVFGCSTALPQNGDPKVDRALEQYDREKIKRKKDSEDLEVKKMEYYNCTNFSIKNYAAKSNDLKLVKKAVKADCYDARVLFWGAFLKINPNNNYDAFNSALEERLGGDIAGAIILNYGGEEKKSWGSIFKNKP